MTNRQKLIKAAAAKLSVHNIRSKLEKPGYRWIYPRTIQMIELIEGIAKELGNGILGYYLSASDRAYYMLENEIYKIS